MQMIFPYLYQWLFQPISTAEVLLKQTAIKREIAVAFLTFVSLFLARTSAVNPRRKRVLSTQSTKLSLTSFRCQERRFSTSMVKSLNLREGQPRPGAGFGLGLLFRGKVWTHSALFSFKIWEQTKTSCC